MYVVDLETSLIEILRSRGQHFYRSALALGTQSVTFPKSPENAGTWPLSVAR